jgi:hypothetical protein
MLNYYGVRINAVFWLNDVEPLPDVRYVVWRHEGVQRISDMRNESLM